MIPRAMKNLFRSLIYDRWKYGCNRMDMYGLHVQFSVYMLPRVTYLIENLGISTHIPPLRNLNFTGEIDGTMTIDEWRIILEHIQFALAYDTGEALWNKIPSRISSDYDEYAAQVTAWENRYRMGLRYLGLYYSDIWG